MRRARVLGAALAAMLGWGCLVHVDHVRDPGPAFKDAYEEASRAGRRGGSPGKLALLAYDSDDGELVRLELPLWMVRKVCDEDGGFDIDLDGRDEERARKLRRRIRWEDIEDAGPGVLLEVEDDDGQRVLVWLR